MENRIHMELPEGEKNNVLGAIDMIINVMTPHIVTLDQQERRRLPKMGTNSLPFVEKVIDYAKSDPQFNPPFVDPNNMEVDFLAVRDVNQIIRPLEQLLRGLEDINLLAGSEAYVAALSYYNSVKLATKMNIPEAETIYNDLKERFDHGRKRTTDESENTEE